MAGKCDRHSLLRQIGWPRRLAWIILAELQFKKAAAYTAQILPIYDALLTTRKSLNWTEICDALLTTRKSLN